MMLLPSGRSNSDVYPLQNSTANGTTKPLLLTRTSSPQLTIATSAASTTTINPQTTTENVVYGTAAVTTSGVVTSTAQEIDNKTSSPTAGRATAGSRSETGSNATDHISSTTGVTTLSSQLTPTLGGGHHYQQQHHHQQLQYPPLLGNSVAHAAAVSVLGQAGNWEEIDRHLGNIQCKLKAGWTVHVGKEGRLYYCNHLTQTSGWLPSCEDWSRHEELPYGWERAIDSKGRSYYINHLNKTSTYEAPECVRWDEQPPEPRLVVLQRNAQLGFGFVAGSERPVIVRFVTEGGPSINKLQPGDQILAVNGEDVKEAPRDHVIQLVRACETQVSLLVCQPSHTFVPGRKSTLLSAGKRAKLRTRPSRVRFAESVCVNGAPLFPPSAFSLGDICVPPMANVLKVFLENGQTKSFKYDATTSVQDVVSSLLDKLCLSSGELFSLVLEHVKSLKRNKLTLLDPEESLARIAARPGAHKLRCLFRVSFVPISAAELAQKDMNALDYLYLQCCNDVTQERFAPELQPEVALRLAALHMHQHALANNFAPAKLTVKVVEREFGLERFVPVTLFEGMKRKELRRLISHFLKLNAEMTGSSTKVLTQLQAKLHYLDIIASLPSYGAKCFSTNQREGMERVLLVSPRFGLSQISSARNAVPQAVAPIQDFTHVVVTREDDVTCSVSIFLVGDRACKAIMEDRDANEFSLVLAGYYRMLTGSNLTLVREREQYDEDNSPSYLAQHTVLPAIWSYLLPFHNRAHSVNFLMTPPYHPMPQQAILSHTNGQEVSGAEATHSQMPFISSAAMDLDIHSVMATELLEEAKDSGMSDSSGGGSNYCERPCNDSAFIEAKNEQVLRRVHEMQQMVESSEQYLNEQGELVQDYDLQQRHLIGQPGFLAAGTKAGTGACTTTAGVIEFDSDCDSLNSSKVSSTEEASGAALKHSDSLTLLAESINNDLNGINQGLNSIGGNGAQPEVPNAFKRKPSLCSTSSPRPLRKMNDYSQLLSDIQALGTDFSQSESDSESVASPTQSPTTRRPMLLPTGERSQRKQNLAYRSSFGLHSPDGNNFCTETKDYNLKEYLKQLKEISNVEAADTDVAAKKLSEIYGFEIREDTFIETDTDLIDLRAIPPPQTPDELDSLSLLNAPPKGFDDVTTKKTLLAEAEVELDKFLEKVVVAPPTQKATPAKELTPEEIMSFIIPPPPNLDEVNKVTNVSSGASNTAEVGDQYAEQTECLYSNSVQAKREFFQRSFSAQPQPFPPALPCNGNAMKEHKGHVIEYATVERKSKFSCCPKSKKEEQTQQEITEASDSADVVDTSSFKLPPRTQSLDHAPPARPPKSAELIQRFSPKKQPRVGATIHSPQPTLFQHTHESSLREVKPPQLPPRISPTATSPPVTSSSTTIAEGVATLVSVAPKKPPLPPISNRPQLRNTNANANANANMSYPTMSTFVNGNSQLQQQQQQQQQYQQQHQHQQQARQQVAQPPAQLSPHSNGHNFPQSQPPPVVQRPPLTLLCSPQMHRKLSNPNSPAGVGCSTPPLTPKKPPHLYGDKMFIKNGHVIDGEALLGKTDVAMAGLLIKLDQVAAQCSAAQSAGGGSSIDEDKFQRARNELTEQTLALVTASKFLVAAMSDMTLSTLPEHLTSCLTAIRRITELTQDMTRHTSAPLQTRNIVLKVHDVAASFRELVGVQIGPLGAGQLALQAECLANVLATLLRSLRVFSP